MPELGTTVALYVCICVLVVEACMFETVKDVLEHTVSVWTPVVNMHVAGMPGGMDQRHAWQSVTSDRSLAIRV